ncbi:MAG: O-antigen ligase family protein [Bacteroidetes bacterium]|nr:O-antigen ligase family protein [Bacteroidota bacterium]
MRNYFKIDIIAVSMKWLLMALFLFPILPLNITNILFIVFCVISLLAGAASYKYINWKVVGISYLISIAFIPYMIEYLINTNDQLMQIEFLKKLPFLFAPIAFAFYFTMSKAPKLSILFSIFSYTISLISMVGIVRLFINIDKIDQQLFENGAFLIRQQFEEYTKLHPTYFGLFAALGIFWLLIELFKKQGWNFYVNVFLICILLFNLILLATKTPFFIVIVGSIWIVYKKKRSIRQFSILAISIIMGAFILSISTPSLKNRITEVEDVFIDTGSENNTINQRQTILSCNTELFIQHFWTGCFTKNTQLLLDGCYISKSRSITEKGKFNSHNQFFTLGISYGILVLCLFIYSLYRLFRKAKGNLYLTISTWTFVLIMLTESILERQMGVYAFVFFSLLILNSNKKLSN